LTLPLDDILDDLELPRAEPGIGYLERLFLRFVERVPFETASKIRRHARVVEPAMKPRTPQIFWQERLEEGAGGTCFARVAAFDELLAALGFATGRLLGTVKSDFDHAWLLVKASGGEWICDVGFPLPALIPAREGRVETGMGPVAVRASERGWKIDIEDGVPDAPHSLELFTASVSADLFRARWEAIFRADSKFLGGVSIRRQLEARAVSFARGEMRVDDRHSRTRIPLPAPRAAALAESFGIDETLLQDAFSIVGDPEPTLDAAEIRVCMAVARDASTAWNGIASAGAWARLHEGVAEVATEKTGQSSWTARLGDPAAGAELCEEVVADHERRSLRVTRGSRTSFWEVEEGDGRVWLARRAPLEGPRLDLLRNDSLRGRIAGTLAVDLLAWARRLGER
jgi:arylamine N-acetyltransferase